MRQGQGRAGQGSQEARQRGRLGGGALPPCLARRGAGARAGGRAGPIGHVPPKNGLEHPRSSKSAQMGSGHQIKSFLL